LFKGCSSNFDLKCSNFKSRYKQNNYLALNNMYCPILLTCQMRSDYTVSAHDH